jgi:hypothetical protein
MMKPKAKPPVAATPPQKFNELLSWHMANGTRPDASSKPGESWRSDLLATATRCNVASITNWRRGRFIPGERHVLGLANAFFGSNPSLRELRGAFLGSWKEACLKRRHSLLHVDRKNPEDVRNHVTRQLSNLCRSLELPLSRVNGAADHLLGVVTRKRSEAA